jgi:hypothetical protein
VRGRSENRGSEEMEDRGGDGEKKRREESTRSLHVGTALANPHGSDVLSHEVSPSSIPFFLNKK